MGIHKRANVMPCHIKKAAKKVEIISTKSTTKEEKTKGTEIYEELISEPKNDSSSQNEFIDTSNQKYKKKMEKGIFKVMSEEEILKENIKKDFMKKVEVSAQKIPEEKPEPKTETQEAPLLSDILNQLVETSKDSKTDFKEKFDTLIEDSKTQKSILNEFLGNPCKIGELFTRVMTVMENSYKTAENKLNDEQKNTLVTLKNIFQERYNKDELV